MRKIFGLGLTLLALTLVSGVVAPAVITLNSRTATGTLVNDANGLLIFRGIGPYGSFFTLDANGKMKLDFNVITHAPFAPYALGLNPDSTNKFTEVFAIQNSGPEAYTITIDSSNPRVMFWLDGTGMWWGDVAPTVHLVKGTLASGSTLEIGVYVDATGLAAGATISATITITATNP